jgi:hypothetical protein
MLLSHNRFLLTSLIPAAFSGATDSQIQNVRQGPDASQKIRVLHYVVRNVNIEHHSLRLMLAHKL